MTVSQLMFPVNPGMATMLVKSIPVKVIAWLKNLGLYQELGDGSVEINADGIRVNLDPADDDFFEGGYISVTGWSETIHIDWTGNIFGSDFSDLRTSRKNLADADKNLSEFVEVEKMFYDRLDALQRFFDSQNDPVKAMIERGWEAVQNTERQDD